MVPKVCCQSREDICRSQSRIELGWGKNKLSFLHAFSERVGCPLVTICDGDALPPNENKPLWNALKDLALIANVPNATSFEELRALTEKAGVYTANTSPTEKFEDISDVKNYKSNNAVYGDGKVQQGRYIAAHIPCPKEVEEILQYALRRLGK